LYSTCINNIVLGLKVHNRPFRGRYLFTQFLDPVLQPNTCTPCRLVFRLQLIGDIGIRNSIGDLGSTLSTICPKTDLNYVTQTNTLNRQPVLKGPDRTTSKLKF